MSQPARWLCFAGHRRSRFAVNWQSFSCRRSRVWKGHRHPLCLIVSGLVDVISIWGASACFAARRRLPSLVGRAERQAVSGLLCHATGYLAFCTVGFAASPCLGHTWLWPLLVTWRAALPVRLVGTRRRVCSRLRRLDTSGPFAPHTRSGLAAGGLSLHLLRSALTLAASPKAPTA